MKRILKYHKNRKGITIVLVALMLAVLLVFLGLAVDISYMYFVKNQLQVAADAAAIAGAALVNGAADSGSNYAQLTARQEAWKFACKNKAANAPVYLVTNTSTDCNAPPASGLNESANASTGDIVVGYWNSSTSVFTPATGSTGLIINALQARPRRTNDTPGMPQVGVFVGQIFRFFGGSGWPVMSARASAIGARPPRSNLSVTICARTCTELSPSPSNPITLYWSPYPSEVDPGNQGIAWTILSDSTQSTPTGELATYFCGRTRDACGLTVYASNGYNNAAARQFRCAFKNPLYESDRKTCADGLCDSSSDTVTSWKVLVPVLEGPAGCPPGAQPNPHTVVSYAEMTIREVYASGGGGPNFCACDAYDASALNGPNAIVIIGLTCAPCPAINFFGSEPVLVK